MGNRASAETKTSPAIVTKTPPAIETKMAPATEEKKALRRVEIKAPSAPPAPSQLLPFCEYLQLRLRSDNLELLRRIVSEFLSQSPRFTTVDSMVQLAFPVVALLPVESDDPIQRAEADAILSKMKQRHDATGGDVAGDFDTLQWALSKTVELKNWDWLAQMYLEFCMGEEHCLVEFVRLQRQAISILPVAPTVTAHQPAPHSGTEATGGRAASHAVDGKVEKLASHTTPIQTTQPVTGTDATSRTDALLEAMRDHIFQEYRAVEDTAPWKSIFGVSKIEYPFDAKQYPELAHKFKKFWEKHAHAVWERMRWPRLSPAQDGEKNDRKWRQERASRLFESWVIVPMFQTFGAKFFVEFDKRPELHHWWWYRRPVVDLYEMCLVEGEEAAVNYLKSTGTERFPDPRLSPTPTRFRPPAGWSMFSTKPKFKSIRLAIERAKQADVEASDGRPVSAEVVDVDY